MIEKTKKGGQRGKKMDETKTNRDKCKAVEDERSSCTEMTTTTMTKKSKREGQRRRETKRDEGR